VIVRPRLHWLRMLFVVRGSLLPRILPQLAFTTVLACLVVKFHGELLDWKVTLTTVPFSLMGVALAIFLGFRNNASYDRYWEARKLWGRLLNDSRTAARQSLAFCPQDARPFVLGLVAYVHAVRHQLRGTDASQDMRRLLPAELASSLPQKRFAANRIGMWLSGWLRERIHNGELSPILAAQIDNSLSGLNDAYGGCERIASTPLPFTYSVILHRTVYLYCMMLPFGLLDTIGWMTPLVVAFVSYTFFAIEEMSEEIEHPFGIMPNDLPLDAMAANIEASLKDMLGDADLPSMPQPVNFMIT
jgi:putative membrane protein